MTKTIEEMKAEVLTLIIQEEVGGIAVGCTEYELPDPMFSHDRVSKKIRRDLKDPKKWVTKTGKILDFRLAKANTGLVISSGRLDLRSAAYWLYDINWDDGTFEKDVFEFTLSCFAPKKS